MNEDRVLGTVEQPMYAFSPQTLPIFVEGRGGGGFTQAKVKVPLYECTELITYPNITPLINSSVGCLRFGWLVDTIAQET